MIFKYLRKLFNKIFGKIKNKFKKTDLDIDNVYNMAKYAGYAYHNQEFIQKKLKDYTFVKDYTFGSDYAFLAKKDDNYLLSVKGSDTNFISDFRDVSEDWIQNFDIKPCTYKDVKFAEGYFLPAQQLSKLLLDDINSSTCNTITITSHSRGSAIASILAILLNDTTFKNKVTVYSFGQPRIVCSDNFKDLVNGIKKIRILTEKDPVTAVPINFGTCKYYSWGDSYMLTDSNSIKCVDPNYCPEFNIMHIGYHFIQTYIKMLAIIKRK
jgi:hypothetical protein